MIALGRGAIARIVLAALVLGGWFPVAARAGDEGRRVEFAVHNCPPRWNREILRVAHVELGDLLQIEPPAPGEAIDRVTVECRDGAVDLRAASATSARPISRQVALDGLPLDAQPRAIALVALELLASVSKAVRQKLDNVDANAGASPPAPASQPTVAPVPRLRLAALGMVRAFTTDRGLAVWGGGVRLDHDFHSRLGLTLDLDAGRSSDTVALGDVVGVLGSSSIQVNVRARAAGVLLRGGLGLRLGIARITALPGAPMDVIGRSISRPWAGPFAATGLVLGRGRTCVLLAAEAGFATVGAEGIDDVGRVLAVSGPWLGVSLGIGAQGWNR